jgi:hypothetical protein
MSRSRRRGFTHLLLVALSVAALAVPAHAATWESPVALSGGVASADGLQLVEGADGRVLVVWTFRLATGVSGVDAVSRRPDDGRWGPPRALGTWVPRPGAPARATGVGSTLVGISAYGANRWLGLGIAQHGLEEALEWWKGTTIGAAHRGGVLPEEPWAAGNVAAFPDGSALIAYTTMWPRRGSGSNLRPRVVVVTRGSSAGFGPTRRISPLPPGPPYGGGLGPALSATTVTAAAGGRGTVVVAWQRTGRIEARVSRDRGRTFGRIRYLGPSQDAFPRLSVQVSPAGKVVVAWGTREAQGASRTLVSRAAVAAPCHGFTSRLLERSAVLDPLAPQATDQFGQTTLAGFDGETPFAAWQTVVDGHAAVRAARLEGDPMTTTFTASTGEDAVLDDLTTSRAARAAIAWHGVGMFGAPGPGFVAQATGGGLFGGVQQLPGAVGVGAIRLAYDPRGLLAAWSVRSGATSTVLAAELR